MLADCVRVGGSWRFPERSAAVIGLKKICCKGNENLMRLDFFVLSLSAFAAIRLSSGSLRKSTQDGKNCEVVLQRVC